jgi:hypothetical protein
MSRGEQLRRAVVPMNIFLLLVAVAALIGIWAA